MQCPCAQMFYKAARVEYHPVGVVGAIVPWNYPFHNVFNPLSAALFAGNALVIKARAASATTLVQRMSAVTLRRVTLHAGSAVDHAHQQLVQACMLLHLHGRRAHSMLGESVSHATARCELHQAASRAGELHMLGQASGVASRLHASRGILS